MSDKYKLYGAPFSLYTGKARAYLINKRLPYEDVFSSLNIYKKIIIPHTGVRFIPVLKTPQEEYIQDTSVIIDTIEIRHPDNPLVPATPKQKLVSHLFEIWADEWLLIPAMHYRWNKANFPFIYQEFGSIVFPRMPAMIRAFVGKKIGSKFKGFVPMLGITPTTIPAIEDWYENHVLHYLDQHFSTHNYLLGAKPSLGDFGLMGPLYAHLYRDPASGEIIKNIAPNVVKWIERMNNPDAQHGEWLNDDEIPEMLYPLLQRIFAEFWPVLENTVEQLSQWHQQNPSLTEPPRSIGEHTFTIGEVTEKRAIMPFHQWKLQRVLDCYNNTDVELKAPLDEMLSKIGGKQAMQLKITKRVSRVSNKLVFD
jgi:glutathione S-transferase